jgi:hypothetical protein
VKKSWIKAKRVQQRSLSPPYPLADMATFDGKLAASAPWRAGNSKMARVLERAHASLLGEARLRRGFAGLPIFSRALSWGGSSKP